MSELQNAAKWDMALTKTGQCRYSIWMTHRNI